MGRNKEIRKKIQGHREMVREHQTKIEREQRSPNPRVYLIAYWEKRIREVEDRIRHLEEQLRRH